MPDPVLTGGIVDALDDAAFVLVRDGGARDSQGRTAPRQLRLGAHHNPSARRLVVNRDHNGPGIESENAIGPDQDRNKGTLNRQAVSRVIAAINAGELDGVKLTIAERTAAWNHMRQHAIELGVPMPPKRF